MPKGYRHLTYDIRCQIYALLKRGIIQEEISKQLKVDQSTISREVKRNKGKRGYRHKQAHEKAVKRKYTANARSRKIVGDVAVKVEKYLCERQWSPEQISAQLKKEDLLVSHEVIYRYIWSDKHRGGKLHRHLRNKGIKYRKRGKKLAGRGLIPNRVDIEERPEIVDQKARIGDFEVDTIVGKNHQGGIVSIVERKTMFVRLALVKRATSKNTARAIVDLMRPLKWHTHTFTADNGKEFAQHQKIAQKLKASFYFAKPYAAWQRGLNENINRLVRQYFPKGTSFATLTQRDVEYVEYLLNTRPRKTLNFETPFKVFYQHTGIKLNYALRC